MGQAAEDELAKERERSLEELWDEEIGTVVDQMLAEAQPNGKH